MNALKIIARAFLILLIVSSGFQTALAALGIVVAFQTAAENPRLFGNMVGRLTGSLLALVFCIWAFRKLRTQRHAK